MSEMFDYIKIQQNQQVFYSTVMKASVLYTYGRISRQSDDEEKGVQRFLDQKRVNDIAEYCRLNTQDLQFLTPIVISLNSDYLESNLNSSLGKFQIDFTQISNDDNDLFNIIDGQHRIEGIKRYENLQNKIGSISLPVIFVLDASVYQSAQIFVTINANQKKVDNSMIYQLFGLMERNGGTNTPQAFASKVVSILNENESSPFRKKIKILGRKIPDSDAFISQATIANKIVQNIWTDAKHKNRQFTEYFNNDDYKFLAKAIINYFNAFISVNALVWNDPTSMAKKAIGFSALMKLFLHIEKNETDLTEKNFENIFNKIGQEIAKNQSESIQMLFKNSGSSESVASKIGKKLQDLYEGIK
ncbi:DGQHR domain-containing protein [Leuconostoc suionicum]|uniref:DGQHR domain-containing protein n=1 Tax=Leuconostoc suionicum TaxID=1511761 RepID=UPI001B8B252E|nr:DGQHR domain-containing protein [Leuconostoc suionicum]MBS1008090.1 DGQHR domain-containing protein [Leuconostoc suionicum]